MNQRRGVVCLFLSCLVFSCGSADGDDTAGSGGAGGTGGTGVLGGASGLGGSGGTAIPRPTGTIGSGSVECYGIAGDACPPGQACCYGFPFADNTCVTTLGACASRPLGCDDPQDCAGAQCCATLDNAAGVGEFVGTSCKAQCDPAGDVVVCSTNADCPPTAGECSQSSDQFLRCF